MNKTLGLLGLCIKARKCVFGEDAVINKIRLKEGYLCIAASDLGASTRKKLENKCTFFNVKLILKYNTADLNKATGKKYKIYLITDKNLAKAICEKEVKNEGY